MSFQAITQTPFAINNLEKPAVKKLQRTLVTAAFYGAIQGVHKMEDTSGILAENHAEFVKILVILETSKQAGQV